LTVAIALELEHYQHGRSHFPGKPPAARPAEQVQAQAQHALTLLDFWAQNVVPTVLLERARARALQVGDHIRAARLERRLRYDLVKVHAFGAMAARDPSLRHSNSAEARALRAAGIAWRVWATAMLKRARSTHRAQTRGVAELEANAVRLHQAAYAVVDASLRASIDGRAGRW
jgi:hypothetical protein